MLIKITIALAAVATLAGCGGTTGASNDNPPAGTNTPSATPTVTVTETQPVVEEPTVTETETPVEDETVLFGRGYTWENNVTAIVSSPRTVKNSSDSGIGGEKFKYAVAFTIVIVNKSGKAFDPSSASATVQSNDVEGDQIFDSAAGYMGSPDTKVLNGRQTKYTIAFGVANPKDVVLELTPGFEYNSAIWTK